MRTIRTQREDFDAGAEIDALEKAAITVGAVASFVGIVRGGDDLTALVLEHYPNMTEAEIGRIVSEAEARWSLLGITIIHRTGRLAVGERVVFVGVASAHRGAAFEACEFLMDFLKTRAPFWKQEERSTASGWVEAKASDDEKAAKWR